MNFTGRTADDFHADIAAGKTFSFTRWGDGEWTALLGDNGPRNCDGHEYSEILTDELTIALVDQPGPRVGIQQRALRMKGRRIRRWLRAQRLNVTWDDADLFHADQVQRGCRPTRLVELLRDRVGMASVVVVGPEPLAWLNRFFVIDEFIGVPRVNCYSAIDETEELLREALEILDKPVFVSVSASMPANVLIHRVHPDYENEAWLMDMGSYWIPYLKPGHGLRRRGHQKQIGIIRNHSTVLGI